MYSKCTIFVLISTETLPCAAIELWGNGEPYTARMMRAESSWRRQSNWIGAVGKVGEVGLCLSAKSVGPPQRIGPSRIGSISNSNPPIAVGKGRGAIHASTINRSIKDRKTKDPLLSSRRLQQENRQRPPTPRGDRPSPNRSPSGGCRVGL